MNAALYCTENPSGTDTASTVNIIVRAVLQADFVLATQDDLSPHNPAVSAALSKLVGLLMQPYGPAVEQAVLTHEKITAIRPLLLHHLAKAEGLMEVYWADQFGSRPTLTPNDLRSFLYWQNYEDLVQAEMQALQSADMPLQMKPDCSIAFVGAGPLPLSALLLHKLTKLPLTCIDNDPVAVERGNGLIHKMGLQDEVCYKQAAGHSYDFASHPVIIVASLVNGKPAVTARIRETSPGAHVALRSAEGLHTLLYHPVEAECLDKTHWQPRSRTAPNPQIINTTLVMTHHA